jgi:hypothetical protein
VQKGGTVSTVPPFCRITFFDWIYAMKAIPEKPHLTQPTGLFNSKIHQTLAIGARFISALCLSLVIGGMAFFGIMAAPVMFHPEKSGIERLETTATTAPQMVSAMLSRFGTLTTICAVLLILCWLIDGIASSSIKSRLWNIQGALLFLSLLLSQVLSNILLPRIKAQQATIVPIIARAERGKTLTPREKQQRAAFDIGHKSYQKLASFNLYVLLAAMLILIARGAPILPEQQKMVN